MYAIIFLGNHEVMREAIFAEEKTTFARAAFAAGQYTVTAPIDVGDMPAGDVAEEMFDLTNNPSRQEEREQKYGRGRSLSVGDIVCLTTGEMYVCCSFGWEKL